MVHFGFAKSKAINFSFKDYFDRSVCSFQRFARQKTIQIRSSKKFKSEVFFAACGPLGSTKGLSCLSRAIFFREMFGFSDMKLKNLRKRLLKIAIIVA